MEGGKEAALPSAPWLDLRSKMRRQHQCTEVCITLRRRRFTGSYRRWCRSRCLFSQCQTLIQTTRAWMLLSCPCLMCSLSINQSPFWRRSHTIHSHRRRRRAVLTTRSQRSLASTPSQPSSNLSWRLPLQHSRCFLQRQVLISRPLARTTAKHSGSIATRGLMPQVCHASLSCIALAKRCHIHQIGRAHV